MFERFTERARATVASAHEEAVLLRHDRIGTEHLLIALVRDEESHAGRALRSCGAGVEPVRARVREFFGPVDEPGTGAQIPFTPRAKDVLRDAMSQALRTGSGSIGTGHVLLGILDEGEGVAVRTLMDLGVNLQALRTATLVSDGWTTEWSGSSDAFLPRETASRAVEMASERASAAGRPVDAADLIVGLAAVDEHARTVLERHVRLDRLAAELDEARPSAP